MTAPTDQQIRDAETWEQCKALELQVECKNTQMQIRRAWLQAHAEKYESRTLMAEAVGMDKASLFKMAKRLGVTLPRGKSGRRDATDAEAYRKCAADGLRTREAAEKLNVSLSTIYWAQKRYGIRFKPARRGQRPAKPSSRTETPNKQHGTKTAISMAEYARLENAAMKRRRSIG